MTHPEDVDAPWGEQLRRWREDQSWTQEDLAQQILQMVFKRNEHRGQNLDPRTVARWETGAVKRPHAHFLRSLTALGAPVPKSTRARTTSVRFLSGNRPGVSTAGIETLTSSPAAAPAASAATAAGGDEDTDVQRRNFLLTGASGLAALMATAIPGVDPDNHRHQTTPDTIASLRDRLKALRKMDDYLGGRDTFSLYIDEANMAAGLLHGGTHSTATLRALLSLYAESAQQAGWAAFDAGWHDKARALFERSHAAAIEGDHHDLAGNALALQSYQQLTIGDPDPDLTRRSLTHARMPGVHPGVRALLYDRGAWTLARAGLVDETTSALGRASSALDAVEAAEEPTPDYAAWIDRDELLIITGRCWTELRRPLRAVPALEQALSRFPSSAARDKALYSSWLAESYLQADEVEQAAQVISTSLDLAHGVGSVRPRARLAEVATHLKPYADVAAVAELFQTRDPLSQRA
ncbi:hypothetical protein DMP14_31585 [Pseudonocardia sp. Ae707_Ps2]|uniref:helix-turn-helix domain-containing protein n=1 Tax=unclassified Pseudonocardia TaxID=2619320 RepID=UPI0011152579|nr:helix-turn-helix transcriptional regulator [Pseudonocardia sp. Ae406_Ps2]